MSATITDLFCGAGGSSLGAEVAGATARLGLNHWDRAIETHSSNFEHADHDCADVSALTTAQIRRYPLSDILLASPECTNHSLAKGARRRKPQAASLFEDGPGGDDEQDKSRATMWDVWRFAEQAHLRGHPYKAIIVENVVDAFRWGPDDNGQLFTAWLAAGEALGYRYETVWLNSMLAHDGDVWVPQSRDRMYVVWTLRTMRAPRLDVEPLSYCPSCERIVNGRQQFKRTDRPRWGRYGAQYFFTCPECFRPAIPAAAPAASIIDQTIAAPVIGERARPLATNTRERIRRGLQRLADEPFAIRLTHGGAPRPLTLPLVTLTARHDMAMVTPVSANTHERTPGNRADDARHAPLRTVHGSLDRALVIPPMGSVDPRDAATVPAPTQTTTTRAAVVHARGVAEVQRHGDVRPLTDPVHTVRAGGQHHGLVTMANRANNEPRAAEESPTHAVLTGSTLAVVSNYAPGWTRDGAREPVGTLTTRDGHSVVFPLANASVPVDAAQRPAMTVTTRDRLALLVPAGGSWADTPTLADREPAPTQTATESRAVVYTDADIDACGFRMFDLSEIAGAMALSHHHTGDAYVVVGNKRERMAQYGNAVTPPAMTFLVARVLEVLDEEQP